MPEILMQQRFAAPPDRVFDLVTDHVGFGRFVGADIQIERQGTPPPNGLGAVRVVRSRGTSVKEEVVRWEPPHAMDYRVIGGAPLQNHLGEIRLTPDGTGTQMRYRIRFDWPWWAGGSVAGGLLARLLEREITAALSRMAATP
ncbi:MAG TPA: SRPBCC family protein [Candidatus Binatia bacterium]|jgi:uncharacterized protein YndB with AHSA1/START domain|nr:SRPBCC family protein [Candidatus Binatia bacterium]